MDLSVCKSLLGFVFFRFLVVASVLVVALLEIVVMKTYVGVVVETYVVVVAKTYVVVVAKTYVVMVVYGLFRRHDHKHI